ncbi:MAG: hypothetical protein KIT24_04420 [Phycisphaeraceae bacterium]|nr:hypothetical protein [Phycisphaeraceae bacterium]
MDNPRFKEACRLLNEGMVGINLRLGGALGRFGREVGVWGEEFERDAIGEHAGKEVFQIRFSGADQAVGTSEQACPEDARLNGGEFDAVEQGGEATVAGEPSGLVENFREGRRPGKVCVGGRWIARLTGGWNARVG